MSRRPRFLRSIERVQKPKDRTLKEPLDFQLELFLLRQRLPFYYRVKVILETFFTFVLLIALALPMGLIACAIFIRMGRPIFFKQIRVGENGIPFYALKFRTMRVDSPGVVDMGFLPLAKLHNDVRVEGRLGNFLRKFKWDELPQFVNVLRGEMLLIGPRPYPFEENYEVNRTHVMRYAIRPGISGPWQVKGDLCMTAEEKIESDNTYVKTLSFRNDLIIFFKTLKVVMIRGEKVDESKFTKVSEEAEAA